MSRGTWQGLEEGFTEAETQIIQTESELLADKMFGVKLSAV